MTLALRRSGLTRSANYFITPAIRRALAVATLPSALCATRWHINVHVFVERL
jgi:hypothetical protein